RGRGRRRFGLGGSRLLGFFLTAAVKADDRGGDDRQADRMNSAHGDSPEGGGKRRGIMVPARIGCQSRPILATITDRPPPFIGMGGGSSQRACRGGTAGPMVGVRLNPRGASGASNAGAGEGPAPSKAGDASGWSRQKRVREQANDKRKDAQPRHGGRRDRDDDRRH